MAKTTNGKTCKAKITAAKSPKAAGRSKLDSATLAEQLSDMQLVVLSAASRREDRTIAIPHTLEDDAIVAFATSLIEFGLAEEIPADRDQPVWRQDQVTDQAITLRITNQALTVLGIDEGDPANDVEHNRAAGPEEVASAASRACNGVRDVTGPKEAAARARKAAVAVPGVDVATDDIPAQPRFSQPLQPRAGSKQGQLIAMLSCEEGASISEIATALGWLPHTTRAALTGLRHKGYELAREINGQRGSLYRITAMPITAPAVSDAVQAEAA